MCQASRIMDEQPPTPGSANAPQDSPPPASPQAPPPIIRKPAQAPPSLVMPPSQTRSSALWKVLTVVFLVLFGLSLLVNFAGFSHSVFPRNRAMVDRVRNLEEITLSSTNSDNK